MRVLVEEETPSAAETTLILAAMPIIFGSFAVMAWELPGNALSSIQSLPWILLTVIYFVTGVVSIKGFAAIARTKSYFQETKTVWL